MDHHDLVSEMASIERMSTQDRLKHARKRRTQQLKKFGQYEKQLDKDAKKKKTASQQNSIQRQKKKTTRVKFESSISLLESAARNDIEEVRILLQNKTDPNVTNEDGLTALHQCCIDDNSEMLQLLLDYGANVNAKDSELWTPLHAAATCGHVHLCKQLIDRGAQLLAVNADGNMPYDICEDEVSLDYIESEMAKRGITQEQIDETRLATERRMLEDLKAVGTERRALEKRLDGGVTPLHIAAANGYLEVADYLLGNHVMINSRDDDSWQPIHAAAYWGQPELLELLVQNGADLDAKTRNGETAFDLCEDPEMKQKILDMKDEIETTRNNRLPHKKHRVSSRSLTHTPGMLYSSNSSLTEKTPSSHRDRGKSCASRIVDANDVRASIRRSSLRGEKNLLFKKEVREEALHFGLRTMEDDDLAEDEESKEHLPATNIDDVTLILPEPEDHSDSRDGPPPRTSSVSSAQKPAASTASQRKEEPPRPQPQGPTQPKPDVVTKPQQSRQNESRNTSETRPQSESRPVTDGRNVPENRESRAMSESRSVNENRPVSQTESLAGPSSRAGPTGSLSDLKKMRSTEKRVAEPSPPPSEPRPKTNDDHLQDLFLYSLQNGPQMQPNNQRTSVKVNPKTPQNGHNNNNRNSMSSSNRNTFAHDDGRLKSFKSHQVIAPDEKDTSCCVIS